MIIRLVLVMLLAVSTAELAAQPGRLQFAQPIQGPDGAGTSLNSTYSPSAPSTPYPTSSTYPASPYSSSYLQPTTPQGGFGSPPPLGNGYQQPGGFGQPYDTLQPLPGQPTQFQQAPLYDPLNSQMVPQQQVLIYRPDRLREVEFSYAFIPALSQGEMSLQEIDLSATLQFNPFRTRAPLTVRPGARMSLWGGPENVPLGPRTYDLYTGFGWQPQITDRFILDMEIQPTISTDFKNTSDSLRLPGRVMGIFALNDQVDLVGGAVYLDRREIGVLPIGGLIWRPSNVTEFQLIFPRPKIRRRINGVITTAGETWIYLAGEYGGGNWSVELDNGVDDNYDYSDIRVFGGVEWLSPGQNRAFIELGYVFNRELNFRSSPNADLDDSLMLRAGLSF